MQTVLVLGVSVEAWLAVGGRVRVHFDGWYPRQTRRGRVFIQRVLCRNVGCGQRSHSLMPDVLVSGRVDLVSVIGWALEAKMAGWGHRRIAGQLGIPAATVRGWLRRAVVHGGRVATRLLGVAASTAARAVGGLVDQPEDVWPFAVRHSAGRLLG